MQLDRRTPSPGRREMIRKIWQQQRQSGGGGGWLRVGVGREATACCDACPRTKARTPISTRRAIFSRDRGLARVGGRGLGGRGVGRTLLLPEQATLPRSVHATEGVISGGNHSSSSSSLARQGRGKWHSDEIPAESTSVQNRWRGADGGGGGKKFKFHRG